jgi:hypothetical protein
MSLRSLCTASSSALIFGLLAWLHAYLTDFLARTYICTWHWCCPWSPFREVGSENTGSQARKGRWWDETRQWHQKVKPTNGGCTHGGCSSPFPSPALRARAKPPFVWSKEGKVRQFNTSKADLINPSPFRPWLDPKIPSAMLIQYSRLFSAKFNLRLKKRHHFILSLSPYFFFVLTRGNNSIVFSPFANDQIMGGRIVQGKVILGSKDGDNDACLSRVSNEWVLFSCRASR